jgi:hypothetical protein
MLPEKGPVLVRAACYSRQGFPALDVHNKVCRPVPANTHASLERGNTDRPNFKYLTRRLDFCSRQRDVICPSVNVILVHFFYS